MPRYGRVIYSWSRPIAPLAACRRHPLTVMTQFPDRDHGVTVTAVTSGRDRTAGPPKRGVTGRDRIPGGRDASDAP
jgi:hypothetical protein